MRLTDLPTIPAFAEAKAALVASVATTYPDNAGYGADVTARRREAAVWRDLASLRWGISEETRATVERALEAAVGQAEYRCAETGCLCDTNGTECAKLYRDALHELHAGTHDLTFGVSPATQTTDTTEE
jgi:hypothetical protein